MEIDQAVKTKLQGLIAIQPIIDEPAAQGLTLAQPKRSVTQEGNVSVEIDQAVKM